MPTRRSQQADRSSCVSRRVFVEHSHSPGLYERLDGADRPIRIGFVLKRPWATCTSWPLGEGLANRSGWPRACCTSPRTSRRRKSTIVADRRRSAQALGRRLRLRRVAVAGVAFPLPDALAVVVRAGGVALAAARGGVSLHLEALAVATTASGLMRLAAPSSLRKR
jgi:hypothetical protein